MKLHHIIIAGSRTFQDYHALDVFVSNTIAQSSLINIGIVSGGANGADKLGEQYALQHALPLIQFPAQWAQHGRKAGILRNQAMADFADRLIAFWDGKSSGTRNMLQEMQNRGKIIHLYNYSTGLIWTNQK